MFESLKRATDFYSQIPFLKLTTEQMNSQFARGLCDAINGFLQDAKTISNQISGQHVHGQKVEYSSLKRAELEHLSSISNLDFDMVLHCVNQHSHSYPDLADALIKNLTPPQLVVDGEPAIPSPAPVVYPIVIVGITVIAILSFSGIIHVDWNKVGDWFKGAGNWFKKLFSDGNEAAFEKVYQEALDAHQREIDAIKLQLQQQELHEQERDALNRQLADREQQSAQARKKQDERDEDWENLRRLRQDYYFGLIDRVEQFDTGNGCEILVDCILENTMTYELEFLQKLITLGTYGALASANLKTQMVRIYLNEAPPATLSPGTWVNIKLKRLDPADHTGIGTVSDNYAAILEEFSPNVDWNAMSFYMAATSQWGYRAKIEEMKVDIVSTALQWLKTHFSPNAFLVKKNLPSALSSYNPTSLLLAMSTFDSDQTAQLHAMMGIQADASKVNSILSGNGDATKDGTAIRMDVYNVGQGACNSVFTHKHQGSEVVPLFYCDFGCGSGNGNQEIRNDSLLVLHPANVPILMSHWDLDHYRIAVSKSVQKLNSSGGWSRLAPYYRTWLGPSNTKAGPTLGGLLHAIDSVNNLYFWPSTLSAPTVKNISIAVSNSKEGDKNNSGSLNLLLIGSSSSNGFLYTGDSSYRYIPGIQTLNKTLALLIATHHGSRRSLEEGSSTSIGASIPTAKGSGTIVYSYGQGNRYGHNAANVQQYYQAKGWNTVYKTVDLVGPAQVSFPFLLFPPSPVMTLTHEEDTRDKSTKQEEFATSPIPKTLPSNIIIDEIDLTEDNLKRFMFKDTVHIQAKRVNICNSITLLNKQFNFTVTIECFTCIVKSLPTVTGMAHSTITINLSGEDGMNYASYAQSSGQQNIGNDGYSGGNFVLKVAGELILESNLIVCVNGGNGGHSQDIVDNNLNNVTSEMLPQLIEKLALGGAGGKAGKVDITYTHLSGRYLKLHDSSDKIFTQLITQSNDGKSGSKGNICLIRENKKSILFFGKGYSSNEKTDDLSNNPSSVEIKQCNL